MAGLSVGYKVHNVYIVALIATMGAMLFGFDISSMSAFIGEPVYIKKFGVDGTNDKGETIRKMPAIRQAGITASMSGGSFVGSLCSGIISDRLGRKAAIQVSAIVWMIGAAVQCSVQNIAQLVVGRWIAGFSIGIASSQVPVYIAELSPKNIRGRLVGLFQWSVTWGILIMFYISYGCSKGIKGEAMFRTAWGIQMVPGLILLLGTLILDESPRWLASRDRWDEVISIIAAVQAKGNVDDDNVRLEVEEIKEAVRIEREQKVGVREMFRGATNLRRTSVGLFCQVWQQMTGMNVMMYYIVNIFQMALGDSDWTLVASSIQYVINVAMTIPALIWIDSWGRRRVLIAGALLMMMWLICSTCILGVHSNPTGPKGLKLNDGTYNDQVRIEIPKSKPKAAKAAIAVSYLFVATFAPTWGPAGWIYVSEIFPLNQRASANGICAAANWIFNFAIGMFTPSSFVNITYKTYVIFAACCLAMATHVYFLFPETKGRTLEEIAYMWEANIPAWKTSQWTPEFQLNIDDIKAVNGGRAPSIDKPSAAHDEIPTKPEAPITQA